MYTDCTGIKNKAKQNKNLLGNFVPFPQELRGNKVFASLMAFSKCVDTQVGLGE